MPVERQNAKILLLACLVIAALFAFGCSAEAAVPTEATPTPQPVVVSMEVLDLNDAQFDDMPSPTPTPEPTPTPLPFSYYAPTVNMTYEELVGSTDDMNVKARELLKDGFPDPKTYYIIVDKQWQVVLVYKRIDDGTKFGKPNLEEPVRYMICSTGNPNKEYGHETTSGIWQIGVPKERFYQFVNLEAAQYLTLIHSRTYFHSVLYDKAKDLSTLVQESYDRLGSKESHACIRLTVPDARWIWYNIGYGTTCEIRDGKTTDTDTASIRSQLVLPPSIANIRLKAGTAPWTDNWTIEDVEHVLAYKYQAAPLPDLGDGEDEDVATPTPDAGGGVTETPTPAPETPTDPPAADPTPDPGW
ncbi:MAG: murein L,D-transpeptidase [Clostridiales bacterium]|nr:murein L,D-transpeptidase [Clostridiales bacterium]